MSKEAPDCALVAVNAKYSHTNLAVRYLSRMLEEAGYRPVILEFTINQRPEDLLREIAGCGAELIMFSCYIWNIRMVTDVATALRQVLPNAVLAAGGPQASCHSDEFMRQNPSFDMVLRGEGEGIVVPLLRALPVRDWQGVPGLTFRRGEELFSTPAPEAAELDSLPFPYPDLDELEGRLLYYESSRGCPFRCSYCLSSVEPGVRFRGLEPVKSDLTRFLEAKVLRVKFVDRTFNADLPRALDIWRFLSHQDNGVTNFHFELEGRLLSEEAIEFLSTVRPGLFQFEIGVQTTNPLTLREIRRDGDFAALAENVRALRAADNIHLHLDLIAGLPFEDYASFARSFNQVYALRPHQLQLGFLKVLGGSEMERGAKDYGLVYRKLPPFQVLSTRWITFEQLTRLSDVENMVEIYYNSGRFSNIIGFLEGKFSTAFDFFQELGDYYAARRYHLRPHSKEGYYEILWEFMAFARIPQTDEAKWLCKYDILLHEKPKRLPCFVDVDMTAARYRDIVKFWKDEDNRKKYLPHRRDEQPKSILRTAHVEIFPFHPVTKEKGTVALLFDYSLRDIAGKAKVITFF